MASPSTDQDVFELENFLPFILNQTAEITGKAFQAMYRESSGMSRTQWRVLAIVGRYNRLSAKEICSIAHEEKSRISRAVASLEQSNLLQREKSPTDKREEFLQLTEQGHKLYQELGQSALEFDKKLREALGQEGEEALIKLLKILRNTADSPR